MTMAMPVREGAGNTCRVMLPGGVWQRKSTHPVHEVTLRAACAADDAFILDSAETMMPCERATALIARCLVAADVDASEIAGALTAGDREALLLQLRRLSFGDKIDCVLRCPDRACGELMDLTLGVNDLLLAPYGDVRRHYETHAEVDGRHFDISFRLPVAYDLDDIAAAGHRDPACGATDLLRRCVERIRVNAADIDFDALPVPARAAIVAAMEERDPQAEIELDLVCPVCAASFSMVFDTAAFLLQELEIRATRLLYDVHTLAWYYHWSEAEIMRMPVRRRAQYIRLIANAATGEGRAQ